MKCRRYVYPVDMVAHLWANQSQGRARNAGQGNFYFEGDTIFSYGRHFPIARHVVNNCGDKAVLFTTQDYSVTTSGHKSVVLSACQNLQVFFVSDIRADHKENIADYRKRFVDLVGQYDKARSRKPAIFDDLKALVTEANGYAEFFGLRSRFALPTNTEEMIAECARIQKREREQQRKREIKLERERAERTREAQKHIQKWVLGKSDYLPGEVYNLPIRLRVAGDELQTSRGARVPLAHAVKAYRIIRRYREYGETYQRNGHTIHLGLFPLDVIDDQGNVTAGCHNVAWKEIDRIATLTGVN